MGALDKKDADDYYKAFTSKVKLNDIQDAINNNDFNQAAENYEAIEPVLLQVLGETHSNNGAYPINAGNIKYFHHFINTVQDKGLTYWFPDDPVTHWVGKGTIQNYMGFNDWLNTFVAKDKDMPKDPVKKAS